MRRNVVSALSVVLALAATPALADAWWSGDWYLKVGGSAFVAPRYQGDNSYLFQGVPMISLGKADQTVRFDNLSNEIRERLRGKLLAVRKIGDLTGREVDRDLIAVFNLLARIGTFHNHRPEPAHLFFQKSYRIGKSRRTERIAAHQFRTISRMMGRRSDCRTHFRQLHGNPHFRQLPGSLASC